MRAHSTFGAGRHTGADNRASGRAHNARERMRVRVYAGAGVLRSALVCVWFRPVSALMVVSGVRLVPVSGDGLRSGRLALLVGCGLSVSRSGVCAGAGGRLCRLSVCGLVASSVGCLPVCGLVVGFVGCLSAVWWLALSVVCLSAVRPSRSVGGLWTSVRPLRWSASETGRSGGL